jgi:MoaA/NifB/PqqE/SkfB family radical SAM enzyme
MTVQDWQRVIDEATTLGVERVQFIGGEPTLHPDLAHLISYALGIGIGVEVFSNLVRVTPTLWEAFQQPGVSLATSYYSPNADEHNAITRRRSHDKTHANIREALRRGITLRVGVIGTREGQLIGGAVAELRDLGIANVGVDYLRQVGRGVRDNNPSTAELCGACGQGNAAISPTGEVWPCIMSRWMRIGNVRETSLANIVNGSKAAAVNEELRRAFTAHRESDLHPGSCIPDHNPYQPAGAQCFPVCQPHCFPCIPNQRCGPITCRP